MVVWRSYCPWDLWIGQRDLIDCTAIICTNQCIALVKAILRLAYSILARIRLIRTKLVCSVYSVFRVVRLIFRLSLSNFIGGYNRNVVSGSSVTNQSESTPSNNSSQFDARPSSNIDPREPNTPIDITSERSILTAINSIISTWSRTK